MVQAEPTHFQAMPFQPVLEAITVTHARIIDDEGNVGTMVQVVCAGPTTIHSVFLEPDKAEKIADDIRLHARQARTGIVVAGPNSPLGRQNGHEDKG